MRKLISTAIFIFTFFNYITAQSWDRNMDLKKLNISIRADAFTATTFIEMEFCNPGATEIEGLYRFQLEPGQVITAFQLDLFGKYRDGSIEEKWKATNAYNTIVGKRVDPALLKMEYKNNYTLNVYPVPAHGCRKVRMTIQQLLNPKNGYAIYKLPLAIKDIVEVLEVKIDIFHASGSPVMLKGLLDSKAFVKGNDVFSLLSKSFNNQADEPLSFSIPFSFQQPALCLKKMEDTTVFALKLKPVIEKEFEMNPERITVFWDVSASGNRRSIQREISFLKQYLLSKQVKEMTIITFNHKLKDTAKFNISNGNNNSWIQFIRSFEYEGATQYGILDFSSVKTDAVFVFSTGRNSFGRMKPQPGNGHVYLVNSASRPGVDPIENIVGQSGGQYINLADQSIEEAVLKAGMAKNVLLRIITGEKELVKEECVKESSEDCLFLSGYIPGHAKEITLQFGNNDQVRMVETLGLSTDQFCDSSSIDRIDMLRVLDSWDAQHQNWMELLFFGKKEKVITQNTAFIVLEKLEDYIKYNITPPKELEPLCDMNQFVNADEEKRRYYQHLNSTELMASVIHYYNERISGWNPVEPRIIPERVNFQRQVISKAAEKNANPAPGGSRINSDGPAFGNVLSMSEVVVTALGQTRQPKELGYSVSRVKAVELTMSKQVNLQNGLTGKVSGLNVTTVNNGVFADTRITLRGIRSLTGNNQPLVILDGMPVESRLLSSINPNNILDVTVLKSAAATAIYGPDGVNGALILQSKKGRSNNSYWGTYKLKNQEDVDYLAEIKQVVRKELLSRYKELKKIYGDDPGFYIDMAQHLYSRRFRTEALAILFSSADLGYGDRRVSKAIGYTLETWKEYEEAIKVYELLLELDPEDLQAYRDLGLTLYQAGQYQRSINILYKGITKEEKSYNYDQSIKAMMLQEMNAIIAMHRDSLDVSGIPQDILKPLPYDLRIVLDCNKGRIYNSLSIIEPGGKACSYYYQDQETKGRLYSNYTATLQEYQLNNAKNGEYKIRVSYSDYRSADLMNDQVNIPTMIRITTFKNFGKPGQQLLVQNVIMDYQYGNVEIGEVVWNK